MHPIVSVSLSAIAITTAGCGPPVLTVPGTATAPSPAASAAGPVRDGALEFVVLDRSETRRVGDPADPGLSVTAKGVFVVVTLSVRNAGASPNTFVDRDQTLLGSRGEEFPVSTAANIYGNLDVPSTRLAPGDAVTVDIAFDVPVGTEPDAVVLRESASSAGVTVPLR